VLAQALGDLPLWLASLFGPAGMSLAIFYPPTTARLIALPVALLLIALLLPSTRHQSSTRRRRPRRVRAASEDARGYSASERGPR